MEHEMGDTAGKTRLELTVPAAWLESLMSAALNLLAQMATLQEKLSQGAARTLGSTIKAQAESLLALLQSGQEHEGLDGSPPKAPTAGEIFATQETQ